MVDDLVCLYGFYMVLEGVLLNLTIRRKYPHVGDGIVCRIAER